MVNRMNRYHIFWATFNTNPNYNPLEELIERLPAPGALVRRRRQTVATPIVSIGDLPIGEAIMRFAQIDGDTSRFHIASIYLEYFVSAAKVYITHFSRWYPNASLFCLFVIYSAWAYVMYNYIGPVIIKELLKYRSQISHAYQRYLETREDAVSWLDHRPKIKEALRNGRSYYSLTRADMIELHTRIMGYPPPWATALVLAPCEQKNITYIQRPRLIGHSYY
jgi:hypothetical protein